MTVKYICSGKLTVLPFTTIEEKGCGEIYNSAVNKGVCPLCKGNLKAIHVREEKAIG